MEGGSEGNLLDRTTAPGQKQSPEVPEINDSTFPLNDLSQRRTWLAAEEIKDHSAAA